MNLENANLETVKNYLQKKYYELGQKSSAYYFRGLYAGEIADIKLAMRQIDRELDLVEKGINPFSGRAFQGGEK